MRIGILTLPLHTNYGGILQAYALQTVLERMGHEVIIVNQDRNIHRNTLRQLLTLGKYVLNRYLLKKNVKYFNPKEINKERKEREQYTSDFINKYLHTFQVMNLIEDFPQDVDAIIVGSDQIWRPRYFMMFYHCRSVNAFLKFAQNWNIKRVAYAASFGTDKWEYSAKDTVECAELLKKFDAVSVREVSGMDLCKYKLGYDNAQHVLDPTLLLEKEDYICMVEEAKTPKSPGNMMCYLLDYTEGKKQLIAKIAADKKLTPFYANSKVEDATAPQHERIQLPVEQWLRGFMDSKFVVTDSFHACVFSIIFGVPFVIVGNKERGMARFCSLLSMFSLERNLISSVTDYNPNNSYEIYPAAKKILKEQYERSISFLENSLE